MSIFICLFIITYLIYCLLKYTRKGGPGVDMLREDGGQTYGSIVPTAARPTGNILMGINTGDQGKPRDARGTEFPRTHILRKPEEWRSALGNWRSLSINPRSRVSARGELAGPHIHRWSPCSYSQKPWRGLFFE